MSIADKLTQLATVKQNIKQAIIDKGIDLTDVPFTSYHTKIAEISGEGGGPGETPADGDYLVRFFDYDGTILKEEWVDSGEDATPPDLPDYSVATNKRPALTFQGWNNSYTNITGNKDIGATYIPTDGKTHAFVRLTKVSGKDVTLYLNKTDTSTLSIDWGDEITTTHTDSGNFNTSHAYSDYGDYEIKIWISSGSGLYSFGNGDSTSSFVGGGQQAQRNMLMYLFVGLDVSSIGSYAFQNCRSLASINLPANVSSIGSYAFQYCYSLTSINLSANLSSIGSSVFSGCHSLTSISIPESVSSIGSNAFSYCYSLTSISIPANVSSIGSNAFRNCYSILKYVFNRTTPPTLANINAFTDINNIAKIYVPDESVTAYKSATNWATYANYIYPMSEMEDPASLSDYDLLSLSDLDNLTLYKLNYINE